MRILREVIFNAFDPLSNSLDLMGAGYLFIIYKRNVHIFLLCKVLLFLFPGPGNYVSIVINLNASHTNTTKHWFCYNRIVFTSFWKPRRIGITNSRDKYVFQKVGRPLRRPVICSIPIQGISQQWRALTGSLYIPTSDKWALSKLLPDII